jgi:phosphatidylglycerol lysyltransferase
MEQLVNEEKTYQSNVCSSEKSHIWSRATELVERYGKDSLAYLTLEQDKEYFFESNTEGFIAYKVIDNIAVCMGNPIYQEGTLEVLYKQFIHFCKNKRYKVCFCSISKEFSMFLNDNGFSVSKYGEEALIDLSVYELKGSSTSKLRQKLRRAEKFGITVIEYVPKKYRDYNLEEKIIHISEQWLANKNGKMGFSLGDLNLDKPLGRRYFVAIDQMKNLHAILMFSPFDYGQGYFLDVMRRSFDAVPGVMEKSIIDAVMKMKDEGTKIVSLGLAPLAGIEIEGVEYTSLEKGMHFMYKNFSQGYDFKKLHDYKKKFAPTLWNSRYIAHESSLSSVRVAYAMIKARKRDGVWWTVLKGLWESRKVFAFKSK